MADAAKKAEERDELLSAEELLGTPDVEYATIPKLWSGKPVRIQSLTAGDLIEWSEANEGEAKRNAGIRLIIQSVVDANGHQLFLDKHLGLLRAKSQRMTNELVKAILKLNGLEVKRDESKKD